MAGSVNKVILIGNLGKDPEIRRLESGVTVASFTLATSENYLDKNWKKKLDKILTSLNNFYIIKNIKNLLLFSFV